jgi:hypothetical protein
MLQCPAVPRAPRLLTISVLIVLLLGVLLTGVVVAARVRARARADWLESKNLTMAPVI